MKRAILSVFLIAATSARAEWLTITGTPPDPTSDYLQVEPASIRSDDSGVEVSLRVNRSGPRMNKDGITFRSYEAGALIDCSQRSARYTSATFYAAANFGDPVVAVKSYDQDQVRPVAFWGMPARFVHRLIDAACKSAGRSVKALGD